MPAAGAAFGLVFGFLISWAQLTDPDVIRRMLLLQEAYVFLFMATAVTVAFVGVRLVRRLAGRALLTGEPISWQAAVPQRRHVAGSVVFGLGWAVADACPGPVAAQLGQGLAWSLPTTLGVGLGIWLYLRRERRATAAQSDDVLATSAA